MATPGFSLALGRYLRLKSSTYPMPILSVNRWQILPDFWLDLVRHSSCWEAKWLLAFLQFCSHQYWMGSINCIKLFLHRPFTLGSALSLSINTATSEREKISRAVIRTRAGGMRSENATSVLCRPTTGFSTVLKQLSRFPNRVTHLSHSAVRFKTMNEMETS